MDESMKKPIMLGVIVVCLIAAGIITLKFSTGGSSGTYEGVDEKETMLVLCRNPQCEANYSMSAIGYYKALDELRAENPSQLGTPPLACRECGEESVFEAVKCDKCSLIFEKGSVPDKLGDTCPKCGYSRREATRGKR